MSLLFALCITLLWKTGYSLRITFLRKKDICEEGYFSQRTVAPSTDTAAVWRSFDEELDSSRNMSLTKRRSVWRLRYGSDQTAVRIPAGARHFPPKRPDLLRGPHSLIFDVYWGTFSRVKRSAREVDHSSPPSAEVENELSYTSTPSICLHDAKNGKLPFPHRRRGKYYSIPSNQVVCFMFTAHRSPERRSCYMKHTIIWL